MNALEVAALIYGVACLGVVVYLLHFLDRED
jgi:hypothetical protein